MKTKPKVIVAILVILISTLPGCRQGARPAAPGNEDDGEMDLALNPAGTLVWSKVSLGGKHGCAIASNKTLWCWGDNGKAQIGDGTGTQRIDPKQINSATNWNQLSAGAEHTCAKKTDGTLWCWGDNSSGKLGIGDKPNQFQSSPCKVTKAKDWKTVSSGTNHTCALKSDGTLWCWGDNSVGELGIGNTVIKKSPVKVNKATNWKTVSAGDNFTCGRKAGTVWCWGKSDQGQLGNGTTTEFKWLPVRAGLATNWTLVAAGGNHACGRRSDGSLWCWGDNQYGQLGDGSTLDKNLPTRVGLENTWVAVATGANHTCGKKSDRTVWCWGENRDYQLGDGTTADRNSPVQLLDNLHNAITDLSAVAVGNAFSCAINAKGAAISSKACAGRGPVNCEMSSDGTIISWGKNDSGQLGDGTTTAGQSPVPIENPTPYVKPFDIADFKGTWFGHSLMTGDTPDFLGWGYIKWKFDNLGDSTCLETLNSSGDHACGSRNFTGWTLSPLGIVGNTSVNSMHGIMSADQNLFAVTMHDGGGGESLGVAVRMGLTTAATADLQGTWMIHRLTTGDAPNDLYWDHAKESMDNAGNGTCLEFLNSHGDSSCVGKGLFGVSLASNGIMTVTGRPNLHGVLSLDKKLLVATDTNDSPGGYNMLIMVKMTGTVFSTADLEGTWFNHDLVSADAPNWYGWDYYKISFDSAGNSIMLESLDSDGYHPGSDMSGWAVAADGVVTNSGAPALHGIMSDDKQTIVMTMNDGGGGYDLAVFIKMQ